MKPLSFSILFLVASLGSVAARADQASLMTCIEKYKTVGLSPDLAYSECKKTSLADCIKSLVGTKFIAKAIETKPDGYLIDLGNTDSRWLEGGAWRELGCKPYTGGPKRRQQAITSWGFDSVTQWYRQGICGSETVALKQAYTAEDAKSTCEIQPSSGVTKKEN